MKKDKIKEKDNLAFSKTETKTERYWFVKEKDFDKIKYCPICGSDRLFLPNDLWEWCCKSCKAWFMVR